MFTRSSSTRKGKKGVPKVVNYAVMMDPDDVGATGWSNAMGRGPNGAWTATDCKQYVTRSHLAKLFPPSMMDRNRYDYPKGACNSRHIVVRYEEVCSAAGIPNYKPMEMNQTNLAMVYAEIVLQKEIDWTTIFAKDVRFKNRTNEFIPTSWHGASDALPEWSNRTSNDHTPGYQYNAGEYGQPHDEGEEERQLQEAMRESERHHEAYMAHGGYYETEQQARAEEQRQMEEALRESRREHDTYYRDGFPEY